MGLNLAKTPLGPTPTAQLVFGDSKRPVQRFLVRAEASFSAWAQAEFQPDARKGLEKAKNYLLSNSEYRKALASSGNHSFRNITAEQVQLKVFLIPKGKAHPDVNGMEQLAWASRQGMH